VSDLAGRWGETAKMKIDGVLGRETLRHFVIRYDPEAGVLEFRRRIGSDPGTPVHLIGRDGCKVMVNVDRVGFVPFLVDTGSSNSGCVARAWLQDAQKFGAARHVLRPGWEGLVLVAFQQDAQVDRLSLGPFTHRDVRLVCSEVNALGTNFLSRYAVTFDFPHRVMYLKPAATYRQLRFYDYHWGVAIHEARENDLVTRVIAPSPASDAGLHVGDVICKIDTLRWRDQSLFDLQELYRRRIGKPVEVVVDRDGVTHTLKLVPREWERAQFEPAIEVSTDWRSP
jgi:hypothetical protein